jgi:hypothetical protein
VEGLKAVRRAGASGVAPNAQLSGLSVVLEAFEEPGLVGRSPLVRLLELALTRLEEWKGASLATLLWVEHHAAPKVSHAKRPPPAGQRREDAARIANTPSATFHRRTQDELLLALANELLVWYDAVRRSSFASSESTPGGGAGTWVEVDQDEASFARFADQVPGVRDIFMTSVMLSYTLTTRRERVEELLKGGCSIKVVLPTVDVSVYEFDEDGPSSPAHHANRLSDVANSLLKLTELMGQELPIRVRFARLFPTATVYIADPALPTGRAFFLPLIYQSYRYKRIALNLDPVQHPGAFASMCARYYRGTEGAADGSSSLPPSLWSAAGHDATIDDVADAVRHLRAAEDRVRAK